MGGLFHYHIIFDKLILCNGVQRFSGYCLRSTKVEKAPRLALEMSKVVDKVLDFSNKEQKSLRTKVEVR